MHYRYKFLIIYRYHSLPSKTKPLNLAFELFNGFDAIDAKDFPKLHDFSMEVINSNKAVNDYLSKNLGVRLEVVFNLNGRYFDEYLNFNKINTYCAEVLEQFASAIDVLPDVHWNKYTLQAPNRLLTRQEILTSYVFDNLARYYLDGTYR